MFLPFETDAVEAEMKDMEEDSTHEKGGGEDSVI